MNFSQALEKLYEGNCIYYPNEDLYLTLDSSGDIKQLVFECGSKVLKDIYTLDIRLIESDKWEIYNE